MNLAIPNGLLFNRFALWLAGHVGGKYAPEVMAHIPPEAVAALFAELKSIQKKHGSWELVEVLSADGESVKVIL